MKRRAAGDRPGLLDRLLLSVMGPPQVGEDKAPDGFVPDAAAELCHKCGLPWAEHERVHTGTMTYRPCPVPGGPEAGRAAL